eukprot:TRINITY_DN10465_c0_g1_i1.p1 TRINITY_DN10465_c0_g1~~TRINITY_DN10465_c0_g1_i1.p1  ORF type:complete len:293 (+),score=59.36 TRINITY_DN10465_c0_g1_i1:140-1018(+)
MSSHSQIIRKLYNLLDNLSRLHIRGQNYGRLTLDGGSDFETSTDLGVDYDSYTAPEIILGDTDFSAASDVWAVGCIFAEMLLGDQIFDGPDVPTRMLKMFKLLGPPSREDAYYLSDEEFDQLQTSTPNKSSNLRTTFRSIDPSTIDLLKKMLRWNPNRRISVARALRHPCFDEIDQNAISQLDGALESRYADSMSRSHSLPKSVKRVSFSERLQEHEVSIRSPFSQSDVSASNFGLDDSFDEAISLASILNPNAPRFDGSISATQKTEPPEKVEEAIMISISITRSSLHHHR